MDTHSTPYVVEPMTVSDIRQVAMLEKAIFPLPWSAFAFEHELRHNPLAYFAVLRAVEANSGSGGSSCLSDERFFQQGGSTGPVIGYAGVWFIVDEAHICTLGVHPDWRGRGLGEMLLVHLIERAGHSGSAVLTLEVRESNIVAQNMYRKYGFVPVGRRKRYYSDNNEDAIIMTTDPISSIAFQRRLQALRVSLQEKLRHPHASVRDVSLRP